MYEIPSSSAHTRDVAAAAARAGTAPRATRRARAARVPSRRARAAFARMSAPPAREWRERGVKRVRLVVSTARARTGDEDSDADSDSDAGAGDGPFVLRCGALGEGRPEREVDFAAWRPRRGLDAEELRARLGDVVGSRSRGEDPFRKSNIIVCGRGDGVDYVGKNFSHALSGIGLAYERSVGADSRTMLGIMKKTGEGEYDLELIPIAGGRVIDMDVRLHKYNYTKHEKSENLDLEDPAVRAAINAKQLEAFASDKRKRQVNRLNAARKLDESSIAAPQAMEMQIKDAAANVKTRAELIVEAGKTRNIPAFEATATEPDLAYPIESTPCYELFHKLRYKDLLSAVESASVGEDEKYEQITAMLAKNLVGGTKAELNKKAQLILYADALCKLLARGDRIKEAKAKEDGEKPTHPFLFTSADKVDPVLQGALIASYLEEDIASTVHQYVMPKQKKDLVRLHVILIALRVNGWKLELEELRTHMKIDAKEMMTYVRQLGCKSVSGGKNPVVKLDLQGRALSTVLPEIRARAKAKSKPRE